MLFSYEIIENEKKENNGDGIRKKNRRTRSSWREIELSKVELFCV